MEGEESQPNLEEVDPATTAAEHAEEHHFNGNINDIMIQTEFTLPSKAQSK